MSTSVSRSISRSRTSYSAKRRADEAEDAADHEEIVAAEAPESVPELEREELADLNLQTA